MELVTDDQRRAEVLRELGTVYLHDLNQTAEAQACFEEVLAIQPDDPLAIEFMQNLGGGSEGSSDEEAATVEASPEPDSMLDDLSSNRPATSRNSWRFQSILLKIRRCSERSS